MFHVSGLKIVLVCVRHTLRKGMRVGVFAPSAESSGRKFFSDGEANACPEQRSRQDLLP